MNNWPIFVKLGIINTPLVATSSEYFVTPFRQQYQHGGRMYNLNAFQCMVFTFCTITDFLSTLYKFGKCEFFENEITWRWYDIYRG